MPRGKWFWIGVLIFLLAYATIPHSMNQLVSLAFTGLWNAGKGIGHVISHLHLH